MEKLRRELLVMCRERDSGRADTQGEWVREYMDALLEFMTPVGVETFDAEQLRVGYVGFITDVRNLGLVAARASLPLHLHFTYENRAVPLRTPSSPHVVSILKN